MRSESFDSTRGSLLDRFIWGMRVRKVTRQLQEKSAMAVDLGCGRTAPLLRQLIESGAVVRGLGVDLAPDYSVESDKLKLLKADLNAPLPIDTASVDLVLSLAVIEHLVAPELHLREVHRILKPGGTLLLTTPSPAGKPVLEFLAFRLGVIDRLEIEDHKIYFNGTMLRGALAQAGFRAEDAQVGTFQFGLNNSVTARR